MNPLNINYGKVLVLIVIAISFYWLMLPGRNEDASISSKESTKSHPHHDHIEIVDKKKTEGTEPKDVDAEEDENTLVRKQYESELAEKDKTIEVLKQQLSSATENDNKSKKELEDQIKKISAKSDETESKYNELLKENYEQNHALKQTPVELTPFKGMKLIHLDLKGAPPKVDYFIDIMQQSKTYGATGLLIEYEDMFPWSGELSVLASKNAYTKDELKKILQTADKLGMEVVPLVQTFGHFEFVLKHKEFAELQAVKQVTTSVCPLNEKSIPLIKKLVEQIVDLHPNLKWIHLGGDEVWDIKSCDRCKGGNYTDIDLYHRHMLPIMKYVKTLKTDLAPIIWDDMMRHWSVADLKKMADHVTPMVWGYVADLKTYRNFPEDLWVRYMEAFPKIFFASSFKGALKPWSNFVPIKQHLDNHLSWLNIYKKFLDSGKPVEGIALTGWSRFDHYGPLCELLPAGIPSMALCLAVLEHGGFDDTVHSKTSKLLGFREPFKLHVNSFKHYEPENGTFVGHKLYTFVGALERATGFRDWANVRLTGWLRPYNIEHGHLSFYQINTTRQGMERSLKEIKEVKKSATSILNEFFFKDTVDEWIADKIEQLEESVNEPLQKVKGILEKHF